MNNDFIDGIQFNRNPKLHGPKSKNGRPRKRRNLINKLVRLFYFLLVLFLLYKGGLYGIESYISFCRGTEHEPIGEFIERYKEISKR
jgi:hypothetical protein